MILHPWDKNRMLQKNDICITKKELLKIKNTGAEMKNSIKGLKIKLREYLGNGGENIAVENIQKLEN